jgi:hypothetical protein
MNGVTKFYLSLVIVLLVGFYFLDMDFFVKAMITFSIIVSYGVTCVDEVDRRSGGKDTGQLKYWSIFYWIGEFHKWLNKIDD